MLIFVAVMVVYWPVYSAGFIWDDNVMLTNSPTMRGPFLAIWTGASGVDFFPVTYSSFWIEWRLWGMNPVGYHVINVLLHAISCVVLWRVFGHLRFPAAWLAALLFALHPVNVESVAWVAERKNVLAMLFYSVTVWAFVRFVQSGKRKWYFISLTAFLLSLLAKPAAVAWPIVAFGIVWWLTRFKAENESAGTRRNPVTAIVWVAPFFLMALVLALVTVWFQNHFAIKGDVVYERDFLTRVATAGLAIWFYLGKALVPWPLSFIYPMWKMAPFSMVYFLPVVGLAVMFLVLWIFRKRWGIPILFAVIYFVVLLAPVLGIFKISFQRYSYVADHWQYFALPAVIVLIAMAVRRVPYFRTIGVALVMLFGWLAFTQARIYHDSETIWTDTLRKNPDSWVALGGLGLERMQAGRLEEGIALCERSLEIYPHQGESHANLGLALLKLGRVDEGIQHLRQAIQVEPNYVPTYCNLADALKAQGKFDEAIALYREAIRLGPDVPLPYNALGSLFAEQRRKDEALELFRKAVALWPDYMNALSNLGAILTSLGKPAEGLPYLQKAVALDPNYAGARANLGNALLDLKQFKEAREQFEAALQIDPELVPAKYGLVDCLKMAEGSN
ncbi:MAG: tetratricopeptide repeat protein [Limisphaerales bacterium]